MKLVQLLQKSFLNKNLLSLMIYVHKNQFQFFHMSNRIIWLTNLINSVHLNSFRPINLLLQLICLSFENTLYIRNTPVGVLEVGWGPEILTFCLPYPMCNVFRVICQVSYVRCHMSGVTCHVSFVTFF